MDELLSLKWNNHNSSFIQILSSLRTKGAYTDVTLACEGKLYNVHKLILSTCSDYFSTIFETIQCPNPVIILKDMNSQQLESLLDYMYLGEVSVSQNDLSSLIKMAECLQLKGLAVPDEKDKRKSESVHSSSRKKRLKVQADSASPIQSFMNEPTTKHLSSNNKCTEIETNEEHTSNEIFIKEELSDCEVIDTTKEEFNPFIEECSSSKNIKIDQHTTEETPLAEFETEPESDIWADIPPDQENDSISSFPGNTDESFEMPTGSGQRNSSRSIRRGVYCKYCCKFLNFRQSDLLRHMKTHTGKKPYGCPHCDFWAVRKDSVHRHMHNKHGILSRGGVLLR